MRNEKRLLSNRRIAILITVVVAVLATMWGVNRTSARYTRDIEAMFYDGVYLKDDGYTEQSISAHLDNSEQVVLRLATVLVNYPELSDKAESSLSYRRELIAAKSIGDKSSAYIRMRDQFIELTDAAKRADLSARDMEAVTQDSTVFNGASIAILNSRYNDKVTEYFEGRSAIARMIGVFTPTKAPAFFLASY